MGKKSVKENKTVYQMSREAAGLTREESAERMLTSASRLEKMENGKTNILPTDVVAMVRCYKDQSLINHYCTHDCELGKIFVPEVRVKDLSQVTLEILMSINKLTKVESRLAEITVDGDITEDEYEDFKQIQSLLKQMSISIDTLQLWVDQKISDGKINGDLFQK